MSERIKGWQAHNEAFTNSLTNTSGLNMLIIIIELTRVASKQLVDLNYLKM